MSPRKLALIGAFLVLAIALWAPTETSAASSSGISLGDVNDFNQQLDVLSDAISSQPPEMRGAILGAVAYGIAIGELYGMFDTLNTLDPYMNFFSDPEINQYRYYANRVFRAHNQKIARLADDPDTRASLTLNEI